MRRRRTACEASRIRRFGWRCIVEFC